MRGQNFVLSILYLPLKLPQQIIYRREENLSESPNHLRYWENILISQFYEQVSRSSRNLGHFLQLYNLFREIFKFREDKSNNVFREILKCFRKTAKFEFFEKQIIYIYSGALWQGSSTEN